MGRRSLPRETVEAICAAYQSREKLDVIALIHGVSVQTILNIRQRHGIPLRREIAGSFEELGRAAYRAGMTLSDIENWARSRGGDAHA